MRPAMYLWDKHEPPTGNTTTESARYKSLVENATQAAEDDDEGAKIPESLCTETEVVVGNELIRVHDYLGPQWTQRIVSDTSFFSKHMLMSIQVNIHKSKDARRESTGELALTSDLRPWQRSGICQMRAIYQQSPHVVLVGDEMGLGKTLQQLAFLDEEMDAMPGSFHVIITIKLCVQVWVREIERNFKEVCDFFL